MSDEKTRRKRQVGFKQFLAGRKEILDAFDVARAHARAHEVETHHGRVVEARLRKWLTTFLPGRFGVCAGYVVSQGIPAETAPHYDVIIYDQLEAPTLWVEESPDVSAHGASRAIPAENVLAVIEVKSSLDGATATKAIEHLEDLRPLLKADAADERYLKYLPSQFVSFVVFVELRAKDGGTTTPLYNLVPETPLRGFSGALVLRSEGPESDAAAVVQLVKFPSAVDGKLGVGQSLLLQGGMSASKFDEQTSTHNGTYLVWGEICFAMWAFNLVAMLKGTYRSDMVSSFHGFPISI